MTSASVQKKRIRKARDTKKSVARSKAANKAEQKSESVKLIRTLAKATGVTKKK